MKPLIDLTPQDVPLYILWNCQAFTGKAQPTVETYKDGVFLEHAIELNGRFVGMIQCDGQRWKMDNPAVDPSLVNTIGNYLFMWYE